MNETPSKLFDTPGYIPLKEYVHDIAHMQKNGPWKLPLRMGDRVHFFFLSLVARFSWFADVLTVVHPHIWSPSYATLISYLKKRNLLDLVFENNSKQKGYFSYTIKKSLTVRGNTFTMTAQGIATDKSTALSKALGEIVERMISGIGDLNKDILVASPEEMLQKYRAVYPPKYHRFLDIQREKYPQLRCDTSSIMEWVCGSDLATNEKVYIPKQLTSWLGGTKTVEKNASDYTSNGCAGYFTKEEATLRGLLEVVHRDGFLVHWLTMIAPRVIVHSTLSENIQKTIREFEQYGISLYILDITSLAIPSIYVVAINEKSEVPQVVLSGASALTFEKAIQDGLTEMVMMVAELSREKNNDLKEDMSEVPEPFISDLNKYTRQSYWRGKEKLEGFQWFISGQKVSYEEISTLDISREDSTTSRISACIHALGKIGEEYAPVVYYPKNPLQDELGFYVAQVHIPKAFPLYLREYMGTFDSDRLHEFATSKGVSKWKLNPLPHMFS